MVTRLPYGFAKTHQILLAQVSAQQAKVVVHADTAPQAIAHVRRLVGVPLTAELVAAEAFARLLSAAYSGEGSDAAYADVMDGDTDLADVMQDLPTVHDLMELEDDAPVIRMINALLTQAVREGISDIHLEPYDTRSLVRFRRDGMLHDVLEPPRPLHAALVSRIKIMAQLDIAEKRLPQDGRIGLKVAGRDVDVRVSTLPTAHGERVVLRLLEKDGARLNLDALGMNPNLRARFEALIGQPHGLILVTGPTGSGKTTTLYAALRAMDWKRRNVVTVEDPVEYDLPGIGQTQVNAKIDMSFARALRAILRQDPDVVMVGEIRDRETARTAVQASLTGHLVLATLHTNDSVSAITRLVDMEVEPFLLASSLSGVLAQRLVRALCDACTPALDASGALPEGAGCARCHHTGYRGRLGIYEITVMNAALRALIHERAPEQRLRAHCMAQGDAGGLRADGMRWVRQGRTSLQEVLRATLDMD